MAKKLQVKVLRTNLGGFQAITLAKTNSGKSAREYLDTPFKLSGYVISTNTLVDDVSGEVQEFETISLKTQDGVVVGTNSKTTINNFKDYLDIIEQYDMELSDVTFMLQTGVTKQGRTFTTITSVE